MTNSADPDLERLVVLFEQTHRVLQRQAARSVDTALVIRNWLFGWYLVEYENAGANRAQVFGKAIIHRLSAELAERELRGTSPTNLRKFRAFYESYREIRQTVSVESLAGIEAENQQTSSVERQGSSDLDIQRVASVASSLLRNCDPRMIEAVAFKLAARFELGWSHYVILLGVSDARERRFYEIEAASGSWSVRELERQINSALYERLALSRDKEEIKRLAEQGLVIEQAADIIKNPYVLDFLELEERSQYSEHELETAIIDKLETFLLELGKGFLFEARQKRFTFDNDHFYVDLVFYNRLLRCYVLIDLKIDKLTHQDLGQMQMYVNYFDRHVKTDGEAATIGIVLCHRKNDALVELTLPEGTNIYASEYQLYLPSKEELRERLIAWRKQVEG